MRTENSGERKRVVILGATGSIGESALKVARDIPERMEIVGLAAKGNAEMVLVAIVGTGGLRPTLAAIEAGKDLAVASKEILVMAGEIVMREARDNGVNVLPVDSEHNAIFQCLEGKIRESGKRPTLNSDKSRAGAQRPTSNPKSSMLGVGRSALDVSDVRRIILTASGGPFRETPLKDFDSITPEQALKHPTWNMGPKITIDSATLFNKGLEMIEAHWLFGVEMKRVEVVIHPQSIVHSMVEFADGSTLAQLSYSNMCFPIQYAVTWPDRVPNTLPPLDFSKLSRLEFFTPRYDDFPALNLARRAGEIGGTLPAVMNAANEVAVAGFLDRQARFPDIWQIVEEVMNRHASIAHPDLDAILQADQWARGEAQGCVKSLNR